MNREVDTMGIIIVEICESNVLMTVDAERLLEEEYPEVSVLVNQCLSMCGLCRFNAFALVNGQRIRGRDSNDCLQRIRKAIDAELAHFQ